MENLLYKINSYLKRLNWNIRSNNPKLKLHEAELGETFIFIRSWNRPLYLWACLDSLYACTSKNVKFVLIDNASDDPLVKEVINGFERRDMFHAVHYMKRNHGTNQQLVFKRYQKELGKYFFLVDSDITIQSKLEWTSTMIYQAENNPKLSLIGSYIDTSDFVGFEDAKKIEDHLSDSQIINLIKGHSVERKPVVVTGDIINPYSPPGRLLLVKTSVIDKIGLPIGNTNLCKAVEQAGYRYGITTKVMHRHLSLLNIYDYPNYDFQQLNKYLSGE